MSPSTLQLESAGEKSIMDTVDGDCIIRSEGVVADRQVDTAGDDRVIKSADCIAGTEAHGVVAGLLRWKLNVGFPQGVENVSAGLCQLLYFRMLCALAGLWTRLLFTA